MRLFASNKLTKVLQKFRPPEGEPISAGILNRSIETAQKRVEQRNYTMRKHTLEYDDVMNKHRSEVYQFRTEVLFAEDPILIAEEILEAFSSVLSEPFLRSPGEEHGWATKEYRKALMSHFPVHLEEDIFENEQLSLEELETVAAKKIVGVFRAKVREEIQIISILLHLRGQGQDPKVALQELIRSILVQCIDKNWQKHLLAIDHLRTEISMRTVAQKDPLVEFKHEAFALFDQFSKSVKKEISHFLFTVSIAIPDDPNVRKALSQFQLSGSMLPPRKELPN